MTAPGVERKLDQLARAQLGYVAEMKKRHPRQATIDRESALLLKMKADEQSLIIATAHQIAKDGGLDDWRQALRPARELVTGGGSYGF